MLRPIQYTSTKIPELVVREFFTAMEDNRLRVGDKLPPERELANILGISRTSLREALAVMEFLGIIKPVGGRKVVVQGTEYVRNICAVMQEYIGNI